MHPNLRSSHPKVFYEKGVLKISQYSEGNTCATISLLIQLKVSGNFIKKEALAQVFSYEFCEIFKNTFFIDYQRWLLFETFSFGLFSVITKIFVADFEHVFVCWERYRIAIAVLRILEIPYLANKCSKSTTETLKQDVKSVKS